MKANYRPEFDLDKQSVTILDTDLLFAHKKLAKIVAKESVVTKTDWLENNREEITVTAGPITFTIEILRTEMPIVSREHVVHVSALGNEFQSFDTVYAFKFFLPKETFRWLLGKFIEGGRAIV